MDIPRGWPVASGRERGEVMSAEGHWCGPKPCTECGEVHGCVCGWCYYNEEDFENDRK